MSVLVYYIHKRVIILTQRIEHVLIELDTSAIEKYVIIILNV